MTLLILGLAVFIGGHLVPAFPALRMRLAGGLGEGAYKGLFSAVSLIGLALIAWGFGTRDFISIWEPPDWTRHLAFLLMLPAMILLASAYIPSRIRTAARHPMLLAVKIWALAHLIANGDLGSILLFGGLLAYAVIDRISLKRRGTFGPLGTQTGGLMGDIAAVAIGVGAFGFMLVWGHAWLIGVPLLRG
jgi:uncharacterized membrane protein